VIQLSPNWKVSTASPPPRSADKHRCLERFVLHQDQAEAVRVTSMVMTKQAGALPTED
jgi:hypothetical protein